MVRFGTILLVVGCVLATAVVTWGGGLSDPAASAEVDRGGPTALDTQSEASHHVGPRIVAVLPNPVAADDRGEFVVIEVPPDTALGSYTLRDRDGAIALPNRTASGRVVIATDASPRLPPKAPPLPDGLIVRGELRLSNAGERVVLANESGPVDATTYASAPEGDLWRPGDTASGGRWVPRGATGFRARSVAGVPVTAGVLPDASRLAPETVAGATDRIYLAGYTFGSSRVTEALIAAADRGVDVAVLIDGGPVGGILMREASLLDRLNRSGIRVDVLDGPHERYRFHHPKYAVVDDTVFVTSENWEPGGTGGRGSRGWAAVVKSQWLAADLAAVFRADRGWQSARPWPAFRYNRTFRAESSHGGSSFPRRYGRVGARAGRVTLVTAPDNAERRLAGLLASADRTIRIQQVSIAPRTSLLNHTLEAARRGVRVRLLLSGAWYVRDRNRNLTRYLTHLATREGLPIEARVAEPRSRYSNVHVKGVIVDGQRVYVGSLNWNNVSVRSNREVGVIIADQGLAGYYTRVFRADWRGGAWRVTVGTLFAVGVIVVGTARRLVRGLTFVDHPVDGRRNR